MADQRMLLAQLGQQAEKSDQAVRRLAVENNRLRTEIDSLLKTNHFMALVTQFSGRLGTSPDEAIARTVETMDAVSAHFEAQAAEAKAKAEAEAAKTEVGTEPEAASDSQSAAPSSIVTPDFGHKEGSD